MLVFSPELVNHAERGKERESEFMGRDALALILLLWPRGTVNRECLPDHCMFLGPKEMDSLSLSWSYRCQMECWPRETLKRKGPESSSRPKMSEKRGEMKGAYDMFNHNHLWSWMIISSRNFFFRCLLCPLKMLVKGRISWWLSTEQKEAWGWLDAQCHLIVCFVIAWPHYNDTGKGFTSKIMYQNLVM